MSIREARANAFLLALLVTLIGYWTIVHNYAAPAAFFWDENYHVASAQKYLTGTFFMEPHPPLGKLLIAAGEWIVDANPPEMDGQFAGTDYGKDPPPGFSFVGYRLIPVLLAWWTAPLLFLIFLLLLKNPLQAALLTLPYLLDTGMIVHNRGAMLDSTMLFFAALTILGFLLVLRHRDRPRAMLWSAVLMGTAFGGMMATKVLGLVLILLLGHVGITFFPDIRKLLRFAAGFGAAFLIVYMSVWQIHFATARTVNPALPDQGYYQASAEYRVLLANNTIGGVQGFRIMLRDSLAFVGHYSSGVPRLDLCKADENGSPWYLWPFGGRTITYRWEAQDGAYRYLYLAPNPAGWGLALLGVFLAAAFLISSWLLPLRQKLRNPLLLFTLVSIYCGYMIAVSQLPRVMYLYHYFLPLLVAYILLGAVVAEVRKMGTLLLGVLMLAVFGGYLFMRPLAMYEPLTDGQVQARALVPSWELHCARCPLESPLVVRR